MTHLSLSLLGPFSAVLDGRAIEKFRTVRAQALLAYLAAEQALGIRNHRREALVELFWPAITPSSGRSNLRQTLYYLRQAVPDAQPDAEQAPIPFLLSDRVTAGLNPAYPLELDITRFLRQLGGPQEAWPQAIDLYRGEFLADFYLPDANPFEEWAAARRAAFRRQALDALDTLTTTGLQAGDHETAERFGRRQLEIDNLREPAYRQLMQLYAWSGRQAEALSLYEACVNLLGEELGAPPDEATTALAEAIRQGKLEKPDSKGLPWEVTAPMGEEAVPPSPYRGLFAFREEDAPFFFGREQFTDRLEEAARKQRLVAVIGPSGSGKSSVLSAGLAARLRAQEGWTIASFRTGSEPFQALAAALLPLLEPEMTETERLVESHKLARAFDEDALPLLTVLERLMQKQPRSGRLLLLSDQFEELYTLCPDPSKRQRFVDALLALLNRRGREEDAAVTFVLAMRADFLAQALAYRPLADALQGAYLNLGPMRREELSRAVEKPAEKQGVTFESGLAGRILEDVSDEPGNLPLLEFALTALWERQENRQLTHAAYETIGRVEGALARYADEATAGLDVEEQRLARRVFLQTVQPGERAEDSRRVALREELSADEWGLAQRLAGRRLLVVGRNAAGQETVELVHEALIRNWELLRTWTEEDRAFRGWQERLRAALRQWEAAGRDEGALLRGLPLSEAENWLQERPDRLSPAESSFVLASQAFRDRRAREEEQARRARERTRRRITLGLAVGLVVALVLSSFAVLQWNQARQAGREAEEARAEAEVERDRTSAALAEAEVERDRATETLATSLASQARLFLDDQLDLAHLVSVEAVRKADTSETVDALFTSFSHSRHLETYLHGHDNKVNSVAFTPDGQLLASAGEDQTILLWEVSAGKQLAQRLTGHKGAINSLAFSPDGQFLASAGFDDDVILWDVSVATAGEQPGADPMRARLSGHQGNVWDVAFSPDGRLLASAGAEGRIFIWDTNVNSSTFGKVRGSPLIAHQGIAASLAFSPDGVLASGGRDSLIRLWDAESGQQLGEPLAAHGALVRSLAFSPDGSLLASGGNDGGIFLWNAATLQAAGSPLLGHDGWVTGLSFSPDGQKLASSGRDGKILIWDLSPLKDEDGGGVFASQTMSGHAGSVWGVAFNADNRTLATAGGDGRVLLWDETGEHPLARRFARIPGAFPDALDAAISPDGQTLAVAGVGWDGSAGVAARIIDRWIWLYDMTTGQPLGQPIRDGVGDAWTIVFSRDSRQLFSAAYTGHQIRVWDVGRDSDSFGQPIETAPIGHTRPINWLAVSPVADILASGGDDTTLLWDSATYQKIGRLIPDQPIPDRGLVFSPDGTLIASAGNEGIVRLWDAATQELSVVMDGVHEHAINFVKFGPDGNRLYSAGSTEFYVWDLAAEPPTARSLDIERYQEPRSGGVLTMAIDASSRFLATAADGLSIIFWDTRSLQAVGPLVTDFPGGPGLRGSVLVAETPDRNNFVSIDRSGFIQIWEFNLEGWLERACQRANRNMSRGEWHQLFGEEPYRPTCPNLPLPTNE